jgi:hypothetical protein
MSSYIELAVPVIAISIGAVAIWRHRHGTPREDT